MESRRQPEHSEHRNFIAGVSSEFSRQIGFTLANSNMVLSLFVNQLGGSNLAVGLVPTISQICTLLPQLFVAGRLEGKGRKMPYYIWPRLIKIALYLLILTPALLAAVGRGELLLLFLAVYALGRFLIGVSLVARMDIYAKAVPSHRLGFFWGQWNLWGKVATLFASFIVGFILSERSRLRFPLNYAALFGGGCFFFLLELAIFSLIREPVQPGPHRASGVRAQLGRAPRILLADSTYSRFVLVRLILSFATLAAPFYIIYAKEVLHTPISMVGVYLPVLTLSDILSNILWSRIADRRGSKFLIELSVLVRVSAPLAALALPPFVAGLGASSRAIGLLFSLTFLLQGAAASAETIGDNSYLLLISPPKERPTYIGLNNTILGLTSFLPALGGILADTLGYQVIFAVVAGVMALALPLVWSLTDAREPLHAPGSFHCQ